VELVVYKVEPWQYTWEKKKGKEAQCQSVYKQHGAEQNAPTRNKTDVPKLS